LTEKQKAYWVKKTSERIRKRGGAGGEGGSVKGGGT